MSTTLRRYTRGATQVSLTTGTGAKRYYHFDHQGTTQCLTDSAGAVTDRFASDAWGAQVTRVGSQNNPHWYAGESGYYFHAVPFYYAVAAQDFEPNTARWLGKTAGFPSYAFGDNRPSAGAFVRSPAKPATQAVRLTLETFRVIKLSPCGGARCVGLWRVNPRQRSVKAWIVQHVKGFVKKYDCAGNWKTPVEGHAGEYWEAWEVYPGDLPFSQIIVGADGVGNNSDIFQTPDEGECSQGVARKYGTAVLVAHDKLDPTGWLVGFRFAPGNYVSLSPPPGISFSGGVKREMEASWNCCDPGRRETEAQCSPSGGGTDALFEL